MSYFSYLIQIRCVLWIVNPLIVSMCKVFFYRKQKYLFFVEWFCYFPLLNWDQTIERHNTKHKLVFLTLFLHYQELWALRLVPYLMWKCMQIYVLIYFLILLASIFYFSVYCLSSALSINIFLWVYLLSHIELLLSDNKRCTKVDKCLARKSALNIFYECIGGIIFI